MTELKTGFTGELRDPDALTVKAREAGRAVSRETGAVLANARDYPVGTGTAVLAVAAAAFLLGYLAHSSRPQHRSWRSIW